MQIQKKTMLGSASTVFVLFAVSISLVDLNVDSASVVLQNNMKGSSNVVIVFKELEMPPVRKHPKIGTKTTEMPSINMSTEIPSADMSNGTDIDLGSRYGIDAPLATLINCKDNEKYQEGSCKEQSSL